MCPAGDNHNCADHDHRGSYDEWPVNLGHYDHHDARLTCDHGRSYDYG